MKTNKVKYAKRSRKFNDYRKWISITLVDNVLVSHMKYLD